MALVEKSRETVEQLLARRKLPKTYQESGRGRGKNQPTALPRKISTSTIQSPSAIFIDTPATTHSEVRENYMGKIVNSAEAI